MADAMSERDELTLRLTAIASGTTIAEQRRRGLAAYAEELRRADPWIERAVQAAIDYASRPLTSAKVIPLRRSS